MRIEASEKSLQQLLSGNTTFNIPDYQRNYAWKSEQIDAFMGDVLALLENPTDQHFFGPLVLLETDNGKSSVIDGQQRLTTIVILLCLIRDKLQSFSSDTVILSGEPVQLSFLILNMLKYDSLSKDRYVANYMIRDAFKQYVMATFNSPLRKQMTPRGNGMTSEEKRATAELRAAYIRIDKKLNEWLHPFAGDEETMRAMIQKLIAALQDRFRILEITMFSEEDAYVLFETLNERGLRLTPSDLLKSFTLRMAETEDQKKVKEVLAQWDETVNKLGDFPFTKFLRHYLLAAQPSKVQAKKIFKFFAQIVKDYGQGGAERNLRELNEAADVYARLLIESATQNDSKLDQVLANINMFSETHRVFLLRALLGPYSDEALLRAAKVTEMLAFRWILIGGNAQELETLYQNAAKMLFADVNERKMHVEDAYLHAASEFLIAALPSDESVRSYMKENAARRELQNYVLKRVNYALTGVGLIWNQQSIHVEHLAPQNPALTSSWFDRVAPKTSTDPDKPTYEDFVGKWGNLSLLEFEINTSIGNAEWSVKVAGIKSNLQKGLGDSQVIMTSDVAKLPEWTGDDINRRTAWVADAIVQITSVAALEGQKPKVPTFK